MVLYALMSWSSLPAGSRSDVSKRCRMLTMLVVAVMNCSLGQIINVATCAALSIWRWSIRREGIKNGWVGVNHTWLRTKYPSGVALLCAGLQTPQNWLSIFSVKAWAVKVKEVAMKYLFIDNGRMEGTRWGTLRHHRTGRVAELVKLFHPRTELRLSQWTCCVLGVPVRFNSSRKRAPATRKLCLSKTFLLTCVVPSIHCHLLFRLLTEKKAEKTGSQVSEDDGDGHEIEGE